MVQRQATPTTSHHCHITVTSLSHHCHITVTSLSHHRHITVTSYCILFMAAAGYLLPAVYYLLPPAAYYLPHKAYPSQATSHPNSHAPTPHPTSPQPQQSLCFFCGDDCEPLPCAVRGHGSVCYARHATETRTSITSVAESKKVPEGSNQVHPPERRSHIIPEGEHQEEHQGKLPELLS